jgi:pyrroline-5-carboxylate reductase
MTAKSVGFIGGGRVAHIILGGWKKAGQMPANIVVSDISLDVLERLKAKYPEIRTAHGDNKAPAGQDLVFAALHPPAMGSTLGEIKDSLKRDSIFVSLAPKLTTAKLSGLLGGYGRIVRMIPNAASIIGEGYNPVSYAAGLGESERTQISALLQPLGRCPEVDEGKLEAYAILTAMGPTYLWFQLCELQSIAESFGLSQDEARIGTAAMVAGAGKTLFGSGLTGSEVIDLIPVKPLGEEESNIKAAYHTRLEGLYAKLKS